MRILITGATGTIGGLILRRLRESAGGHTLRVLARDPRKITDPEGVEIVEGDLTHAEDVRTALEGC